MRLEITRSVRIWTCSMVAVLGIPASHAFAQAPRAIPIQEAPPRAVPVDSGAPAPVRAQPVVDPNRPTGPDEDLYDYATLAYAQQDFKIALKPFSDYVKLYPTGRHAAEAWFRLAECYHKTSQRPEAIRTYNEVIVRHPKSEAASSAAYRLGMYAYEAREFPKAVSWFDITERLSTTPDIRTAASFNKALSFKYSGQAAKALSSFKIVAASTSPAMQKEVEISQQEIATLAVEAGRKEEALAAFKQILASSKDEKVIGDALLRSGFLLNELGKPDEGLKNFERVLAMKSLPADKRALAGYGLIQGNFVKGKYDEVISSYTGNSSLVLSDELRPKQLLIVGSAYQKKQMYRQAIDVFLVLEKDHPDTAEAFEGGYQKLVCFFQLNDKDLPLFTERFEERYAPKYAGHEYLQMARLIRADWWFGKADYPKAAEAFVGVDLKKVPDKVRASVIYKKGFAEAESGKSNDAINSLGLFINDYPNDPNFPIALAQRGVSYKAVGSLDKALADFAVIVKDHSSNPAAEMAYYQSALIKTQTRDVKGMIQDLESLLEKFPNTAAAAEAWYRIGRGYYDLKQKELFEKALEPLRKAIAGNRDEYLDKASQILIAVQAAREDLDGLAKEVDAYREARKDAAISPTVLLTLGARYFERGNFRSAARYLTLASTPDTPKSTDANVWNYLGKAELKNGNFEPSIKALDFYLEQTPEGGGWAEGLYHKSQALLGLGRFDDATNFVTEALNKVKIGRLNGQLQILQGDICDAHGDAYAAGGEAAKAQVEWKKAAGSYVVVSQIFADPEITPEAAHKAADVLDKIGEKEKAEALRKQLKQKYPDFQPKAKPNTTAK